MEEGRRARMEYLENGMAGGEEEDSGQRRRRRRDDRREVSRRRRGEVARSERRLARDFEGLS